MMQISKKFRTGLFTFMVTIVLVLPGMSLADLSGTWLVNSTAPAMGCNYSGTANLIQNDSSLDGSINLTFTGNGCPSPNTLYLHFTYLGTGTATINSKILDFSGSWSINSTSPVMGCNYSGTVNLIQNGSSLKGLINLTFTGNGCPSPINLPVHFTLLSSPG